MFPYSQSHPHLVLVGREPALFVGLAVFNGACAERNVLALVVFKTVWGTKAECMDIHCDAFML